IIIGSGIAGRSHIDLQKIIGMFVNMLAIRNHPHGEKTYVSFFQEVIANSTAAFANQDVQFEELVNKLDLERDPSRTPLFDISMAVQDIQPIPGNKTIPLTVENFSFQNTTAKFDMTFFINPQAEDINIAIEYYTGIFAETTIQRLAGHFKNIIHNIAINPSLTLKDIEIISADEKQRILEEFNNAAAEYPNHKTIHGLFEDQAQRTPDHIAIFGHGQKTFFSHGQTRTNTDNYVTYRQLNEQSDYLAQLLIEKGVLPDTIVGIMMERSSEMIIGIMGILKSGGAYMPIDPDYPQERIDYMLKDSKARILINKSEIRKSKSETKPNDQNTNDQNKNHHHGAALVLNFENLNFEFVSNFVLRASNLIPSNLAYIIYTSGSTGKPKGTLIEHRHVVRLLFNDEFQFEFNKKDVWTLFHSFCFDFSIWEMYGALLYGGKLVIIPKSAARDPWEFLTILKKQCVTVLNQTPASFYNLINEEMQAQERHLHLRYVIFGGEALNPAKLKPWQDIYPGCLLINMYGITETTVHVTYKEIGKQEAAVETSNIGRPIPTLCIYLLDRNLNLLPRGAAGELSVGGEGVARGYLNRPELTHEKFDQDLWDVFDDQDEKNKNFFRGSRGAVFSKKAPLVLYRSGDLARLLENGDIEYLGRIDNQVKIRGFRIETGEIESRLLKKTGIKNAAVLAKQDPEGNKYLCAYIVTQHDIDPTDLREYLSKDLPEYMIPTYFTQLETLPLTPNGKVDRKALPHPEVTVDDAYSAPRNGAEIKLTEIWSRVLGINKDIIGIDSDFFQLGGHSLKTIMLTSLIHKEFNIKIPLEEFFKTRTIRGQAEYIAQLGATLQDSFKTIEPAEQKEYYELSSAQKRLYFLQQMKPGSTAYNIFQVVPLGKDIDTERLQDIIRKLVARHESLRTSFEIVNNEPVQRIHDNVKIKVFAELFSKSDPPEAYSFNLSRAPLFHTRLIKMPDNHFLWFVEMHHIISDGLSMGILAEDFSTLYNGEELSALKLQYKDFAAWQNCLVADGTIKKQEDYWLNLYRDAQEIPRLQLFTDHERPPVFTFKGAHYTFMLDSQDAQKFQALASQSGGTLYMNILAALNTL
ncbi:MAG: amino acid adenylation domain-containing protein, partial [Acidobacteria bacterium]|nr:amino acid adenylation domain-containing protein [Acidobacteriota bacterium]